MAKLLRRCKSCGNEKDFDEFYKRSASDDGYHYNCKNCCKVERSISAVRKRDKRSKISIRQVHRAVTEGYEYDKTITLAGIYKRAHGTCALCHEYVEARKASMDHKIPVSKGGNHLWDNVQLTHLKCNLIKGNRNSN